MNQNPVQVQLEGSTSVNLQVSQIDFRKLSKAQLFQRFEYAEFMMSRLRDMYLRSSERAAPYPFAHDYERGFASAMAMALGFITKGPEQTKMSKEGS